VTPAFARADSIAYLSAKFTDAAIDNGGSAQHKHSIA
jgi:hypothetical protein